MAPADKGKSGKGKGGKRPPRDGLAAATRLTHAGRDRDLTAGGANPVVQRVSTVLVEKSEDLYRDGVWTYGRHGGATHTALREAMCALEDAEHCLLTPSGLLACTVPLLAFASAGGHMLVTDGCYGPTRRFCDRLLARLGCETEYIAPDIGADIAGFIRPDTRAIFLESPASLTFEICDTPAIVAAARAANIPVIVDNTWAGGLHYKPLDLGADISVQANTKYVSGGADALNGAILTRSDIHARRISETIADLGLNVSADDAYLVLRGLRSLPARMARAEATALEIARWLAQRADVQRVLHPALADDPGHTLWKRDFKGSGALFGFVLKPASTAEVNMFLNTLELFGLGFSYGGFESLAIHCDPQIKRALGKPDFGGPLIRLAIGLEDAADLIGDLERAFGALPSHS